MTQAAALDRVRPESARERSRFSRVRRAENDFARALRTVASQVGQLVGAMSPEELLSPGYVAGVLGRYAELIRGWARATSARMLADVSRRDESAWNQMAATMSRELRTEIKTAPTGELMRWLMAEQVGLIQSLPLEAAQRVHRLTIEGLEDATRADDIADMIMRTGAVTRSRANLIARTEVARTASKLTEARATHVGSEGYIWRTAGDKDVRRSHARMEGVYVRWDQTPTLEDGTTTHAGQIYNCRCWPEPVVPDNEV